jgi:hypothetical protein
MQSVAIFPVLNADGMQGFRAVARGGQSEGRTVGEALDALHGRLTPNNGGTVVLIQPFQSDALFSAAQRQRLEILMARWRMKRDEGDALPAEEQSELQSLIDAELQAADARTQQILAGLRE